MNIEQRKVTIGEVYKGYFNDTEEGVLGYGRRLERDVKRIDKSVQEMNRCINQK